MPEVSLGSDEAAGRRAGGDAAAVGPGSDPLTGAMLGMGGVNGSSSALASQMDPKAAQANAQQQMQSGSTEPPGAMRILELQLELELQFWIGFADRVNEA